MPNKVIVLTGATSGIGKALAADLAKTGETLVMVAREAGRGSTALQEITRATQNQNIDLQLCDLSTARGTEAYMLLWVRLYGAMNTGTINIKIMK